MVKEITSSIDRRAAIVCSHIGTDGFPILRAVRDEPTMPEDSGWQFLCGSENDENPAIAKVWLISEVVRYEPSLAELVHSKPGTRLKRIDAAASTWIKENDKGAEE